MSSAQNNDKPKPIEEYLKKADILIDKRFLYFAFNCLGKKAEIQLQNGKKAQGHFNTANLDHGGIVLKNFSEGDSKENAASTKILNREDFVYILIPNVEEPPLVNAKKGVFRTDAEISKAKGPTQRKLVKWNADDAPAPESSGLVLEDLADQKGKWNQFELNQKKFGLKSDFEENMYTTHLNMKTVSSDLLEKAARLEAEILNSTNDYGNRHIREERGLQALQEDNENEEEAYSSVIRTTEKKIERVSSKTEPAEEKKFKGFTNSKREKPAESASLQVPAESNRDIKESVGNNAAKKEVPPVNIPIVESKPNENEREGDKTPQGDDKSENPLSRQTSNLSDEASNSHRHKARLSLKANSFENPGEVKPKEETKAKEEEKPKAALAKQVSMEVDSEKKFNLSDYNSGAITKFKLKVNEKEIKKSNLPFFEIAIPNWQKKVGAPDPSAVNTSWKIAKAAPVSVPVVKAAPTVSSAATAKPFTKTTAPAFTGGLPNYPRPADNMMYPPPFVPAGFVPNNPMGFMPYPMPQQKFQPGVYPYPQNFQPQFTPYVDPNQPSFNMNYPHNNTNNPNNTNSRQGSGKNFNKKT